MSLRDRPVDYLANLDDGVRGLKIAWSQDLGYATIDPEVAAVTAEAARIFEELGCSVDQPSFQLDDPATAFRTIFYTNNFASYGHLLKESPEKLTDNARFCLEQGSQATGADYADALRTVEVLRARVEDLLETYDLLLSPTMAVPPFPIGQPPKNIAGIDVQANASYSPLTRPFNLTGHPAASIPCGFSGDGLPIGLHIIGRLGDEATVLRASAAFEQAKPWAQHRPNIG
jgi:aspartyl-tRNA(Asn)/glutamyl-tRNA(Gln) amidotransferase subunit A